jgi:hypothetical protein
MPSTTMRRFGNGGGITARERRCTKCSLPSPTSLPALAPPFRWGWALTCATSPASNNVAKSGFTTASRGHATFGPCLRLQRPARSTVCRRPAGDFRTYRPTVLAPTRAPQSFEQWVHGVSSGWRVVHLQLTSTGFAARVGGCLLAGAALPQVAWGMRGKKERRVRLAATVPVLPAEGESASPSHR